MNERELARMITTTLDKLGVPYFLTGSIASMAQGEARFTNDVDVVADLPLSLVPELLNAFPASEYYVSESAIREAISQRRQFNIIHPASGLKVDVIIPDGSEYDCLRMRRRLRLDLLVDETAWFSSAEDVILKKLVFFRDGGSEKHLRDIAGVLLIQRDRIDQAYLDEWSAKLGVTAELQLVRDRLDKERESS